MAGAPRQEYRPVVLPESALSGNPAKKARYLWNRPLLLWQQRHFEAMERYKKMTVGAMLDALEESKSKS